MNEPRENSSASAHDGSSRRQFLKTSTALAAGGALAGTLGIARTAHAAGADETIKIALIGCGGRGTQACEQALSTAGPVKLVAMADAFRDRLDGSLKHLQTSSEHPQIKERIDVSEDRKFVGLDAYQKAIDSGVDLVLLTTPPGFRPIHFEAAVKAGKNIFMEKPVATDAPGVRQVIAAAEEAKQKGLKVGVGLQRRHHAAYIETIKRVQDGAIGDIIACRAYWNGGPVGTLPRKPEWTEMEYQLRAWYNFVWICGDHNVEQHIHNLDVINWLKGTHPISAVGSGGRVFRKGLNSGQIFDHHCVEYAYADGSRMFSQCRQIPNCADDVSEHAHGSKGTANLSGSIRLHGSGEWTAPSAHKRNHEYQVEHDDLFAAIRENRPYNEAFYGAESTLTAIMGRMATYSGQVIGWDDAMKSELSLRPKEFTFQSTPQDLPDENGMYQPPIPGKTRVL